jgi:hypothetical protein
VFSDDERQQESWQHAGGCLSEKFARRGRRRQAERFAHFHTEWGAARAGPVAMRHPPCFHRVFVVCPFVGVAIVAGLGGRESP